MDKIKQFLSDDSVFYGLLIALVAITAYGLGKHSNIEHIAQPQPAEVILTQSEARPAPAAPATETTAKPTPSESTQLVASKNGSKYHYLWCSGAKQMKEENKIYFDSVAAARAAGYTPAANCKGLE